MYFPISSKQTDDVLFIDLVLIDLSPLQEARDLSEAVSDLIKQGILNENQGVWIDSFESNGKEQFSHN